MTTLTVLYFASLRERFGVARETVALDAATPTVTTLVEALRARGAPWSDALQPGRAWRVSVDQEMATLATPLRDGAEVALFPPVTGG